MARIGETPSVFLGRHPLFSWGVDWTLSGHRDEHGVAETAAAAADETFATAADETDSLSVVQFR